MTSTTPTAERVRENRLRRMAARQGLQLVKSRRRDPHAIGYGTFGLVKGRSRVLADKDGYGCDLDEIEEYLTGTHPAQTKAAQR